MPMPMLCADPCPTAIFTVFSGVSQFANRLPHHGPWPHMAPHGPTWPPPRPTWPQHGSTRDGPDLAPTWLPYGSSCTILAATRPPTWSQPPKMVQRSPTISPACLRDPSTSPHRAFNYRFNMVTTEKKKNQKISLFHIPLPPWQVDGCQA